MTPTAAAVRRRPDRSRRTGPGRRLLLLVLLAAATACAPVAEPELPERGAEILWDDRGVPHIYAADHDALFRAYGWAQMRSHGPAILHLLGAARGRAAEYFGEQHLRSDRWVRTVGIPGRAERWWSDQDSTTRSHLRAFAGGMNAWAERHPASLGEAASRVLPVRPGDLLALAQYDIQFTFMINAGVIRSLERDWQPGSATAGRREEAGHPGSGARLAAGGEAPGARRGYRDPRPAGASNAWAVAPSRSSSGNALLLANPHLPWGGQFTWYEAHLVAPGVDVHGATLIGLPVPAIAFNDRLGWTHTVNTHDGVDLYELVLRGDGYRFDGETRSFEVETDTLKVRGEDGGLREEELEIRRSVHGPVLVRKGSHAVAMRVAGLEESGLFGQYWAMMRADSLAEFREALRRNQLPMFTVMYADRDGHVLHFFGGHTPDRPAGDWNWRGVVPGDTSATLWGGIHPYGELPRVLDPASGWLQNANDPPWTTTFPRALAPDTFPDYMAPRGMGLRPQRSARMLRADSSITFEEMVRYKHSTRMLAADRLLDDLLPAARERGGERARAAADVLEAWDREADAGSRGAVLFRALVDELEDRSEGSLWARPWSPEAPLSTPDGLADPATAVDALAAAAEAVEERWGRLDPAWGETRRFRRDGLDLPANGASGRYGVFRVVSYERADSLLRADGGDSYVAAVEFTPEGARARTLLGYGNESRRGSPHRTDQLRRMAGKRLWPVPRTREEVEAAASARTRVPPAGAQEGPDDAGARDPVEGRDSASDAGAGADAGDEGDPGAVEAG